MTPQTNYLVKRQILEGGYAAEYTFETLLAVGQSAEFLHACLENLLGDCLGRSELLGLKGREATQQLLGDHTIAPIGHELLSVRGTLPVQLANESTLEEEPFDVRVTTPFKEFISTSAIAHSVECKRSSVPAYIRVERLGAVFPLTLAGFRVGLEFFRSKSFGSMLGLAPTVYQGLYIDCVAERLKLKFYSDALRSRNEQPLVDNGYLERVAWCLGTVFGFDLEQSLRDSVPSK